MKPNRYILFFTILFLISFKSITAQWVTQNSGLLFEVIRGLHFVNTDNGYGVGDFGAMVKTTDGGNNWSIINPGTSALINSVYFSSSDSGFIVTNASEIKKTTDGGNNWTVKHTQTNIQLQHILFVNATTGFAVGGEGGVCTLLRTTDGGNTWTQQTVNFSGWLWSTDFPSTSIGYSVGIAGGIVKTTNGGMNWQLQTTPTGQWLRGVSFVNDNIGWAVGDSGVILKTVNGGNVWTPQNSGTTAGLAAVHFNNANTGYIVGDDMSGGIILKTVDGGTNWTVDFTFLTPLQSLYFASPSVAYAGGIMGTILNNTTINDVDDLYANNFRVKFYPNPFQNSTTLNIETDNNISSAELIIYDLTGKEIKKISNINSKELTIDRNTMVNGSYYFRLSDRNGIISIGGLICQ
jgi:photosystem II stability/assembly factor-like uncharacterized protein